MQDPSPAFEPPQPIDPSNLRGKALLLYGRALDVIVTILIFVLLLTLIGALMGIALDFGSAVTAVRSGLITRSLSHGVIYAVDRELVIDVLSVFVLIELFRTFTDYLEFHRVRLRVLAEVGIAFILREVFIGLYDHELNWLDLLALAILLGVLVSARIAAVQFPPRRATE